MTRSYPWLLVLLLLGCGCGSPPPAAAPAKPKPGPSCQTRVSEVLRARTLPALRRASAGVDAPDLIRAEAVAIRVRRAAFRAIGDGRPTTARRLFAQARTLDLRAQALARDVCQ